MSTGRPPPGSIPTLTEVVSWPNAVPAPVAAAAAAPAAPPVPPAPAAAAPPPPPAVAVVPASAVVPAAAVVTPSPPEVATAVVAAPPAAAPEITEAELTQRVLADVHEQIDKVLEVRLREALAPALARATDALVRDARKALTAAMHDVVSTSVARELGRKNDDR